MVRWWLMRQLARDLLLHPERLRVVQALTKRPMTASQLMELLGDVAQATLYRHVNQLEAGGLIEVSEERQVRGGTERTFRVIESAISLTDQDLAGASAEDHFRYFGIFVATLLSDFGAYLEGGEPDYSSDGVGYQQTPLWLDDAELGELLEAMREIIEPRLDNEPGHGRRRRLMTTILMPDDRGLN